MWIEKDAKRDQLLALLFSLVQFLQNPNNFHAHGRIKGVRCLQLTGNGRNKRAVYEKKSLDLQDCSFFPNWSFFKPIFQVMAPLVSLKSALMAPSLTLNTFWRFRFQNWPFSSTIVWLASTGSPARSSRRLTAYVWIYIYQHLPGAV